MTQDQLNRSSYFIYPDEFNKSLADEASST